MIDTSKPAAQSELLQSYMLGSFEGSNARKNKNRQYYEQHMKAMDEQKRLEQEEDKELKKKMLHLASIM
jgi:hypothetical protein